MRAATWGAPVHKKRVRIDHDDGRVSHWAWFGLPSGVTHVEVRRYGPDGYYIPTASQDIELPTLDFERNLEAIQCVKSLTVTFQ